MKSEKDEFITPPEHLSFLSKRLFNNTGEIIDVSIALIDHNGGGPLTQHTHSHSHLFIVIEGEARIMLDKTEKIIYANESILVDGNTPHSVWNNTDTITKMISISLK